ELPQKIARPIRAVHFQAVAKDGVRCIGSESLHQPVADKLKMVLDGRAIIVIQNKSFRSHRGALHGLPCSACDEEQQGVMSIKTGGQAHSSIADIGYLLPGFRLKILWITSFQEHRDQ